MCNNVITIHNVTASFKELKLQQSYTLEASFCGASLGPYAGTHFMTQDFEDMGLRFCEALWDKVSLRCLRGNRWPH
jgi:hypothetical protein